MVSFKGFHGAPPPLKAVPTSSDPSLVFRIGN